VVTLTNNLDMKVATLYSDGGARGNPGSAGIGYVLKVNDIDVLGYGEYIGEATNNVAEYQALREGLKLAQKEKVTHLDCFLDSELVVKQLKGIYRVKHAGMKVLYDEVQQLARGFEEISFTHVPRAKNKVADGLVNNALDKKGHVVL
jgi:ribonuclease HI